MSGKIHSRISMISFVGFILISSALADRNSKESILVQNIGPEISKENITFILELTKRREELSFQQASTLPKSSAKYSPAILEMIRTNVENISTTLDEVKNDSDIIKTAVVYDEKGWTDGNVIFYIPNAPAGFEEGILKDVDNLLSAARKDNDGLKKLHKKKVTGKSLDDALGILESEIRRLGAEERGPILENGWSPKLTHALKDPIIFQKIKNSNDSTVKWAFEYLEKENVIMVR